jgi:hypothetical protein
VDGVYNQVQSIAGGVEKLLGGLRDFIMNFSVQASQSSLLAHWEKPLPFKLRP